MLLFLRASPHANATACTRVTRQKMRSRHILGAAFGLFAMLMIFAGPLISQGISLAHGVSHPMSDAAMACDGMPGTAWIPEQPPVQKTHHLVIWEKCGYCSLLFQHPPLPESKLLVTHLGIPSPLFLVDHFIPEQTEPPVFLGARSRAPPARPLNVANNFHGMPIAATH